MFINIIMTLIITCLGGHGIVASIVNTQDDSLLDSSRRWSHLWIYLHFLGTVLCATLVWSR